LVDGLGGGVELRVEVRHRLHDLGCAHQSALLAVHELAEPPGLEMPPHLTLLRVVHLVPPRRAVDGDELVGQAGRVVRVDLGRPVDPLGPDPLLAGAFVVEAQELVSPRLVVEVEQGRDGAVDTPLMLAGVNGVDRHRTPPGAESRTEPSRGVGAPTRWHAPRHLTDGNPPMLEASIVRSMPVPTHPVSTMSLI